MATCGAVCGAGVAAFVYAGSLAGGIGEVLAGRARPPPGLAIAGAAASVVAIFATGALITVHTRRIIKRCANDLARHSELGTRMPCGSSAEGAFRRACRVPLAASAQAGCLLRC